MILNALNRYYEILAQDESSEIPLYGYSRAKVDFTLVISPEGELIDVISLKVEGTKGKKLVSRMLTVPEQKIRSSGISPNFMCDNSTYVLGIDKKGKPSRSKEAFLAFKELHYKLLENAKGEAAKTVLAFLEKWNVDEASKYPVLKDSLEEILEGSNLIFKLDGMTGFLHNDPEIKQIWEWYNSQISDDMIGQCLITGETAAIAKLHPLIKNVKDAQSSGASIVSFNASSYESYGKENGYIAPVGRYAAFAYTTVLNHMLLSQKQKIQVGDATTVFWAESPEEIYPDLAAELFNPVIDQDDKENKSIYRRDIKIEKLVKEVLLKAKSGVKIDDLDGKIDAKTRFYILGLSPNASRISIRFFHLDSFGGFVKKICQHYVDMEVIKEYDNNPTNIPIWRMLSETISPKSNDKMVQPLLAGEIMRSIINGGSYPASFYNAIMLRVKTDVEIRVNYIRASIIKAYLKRKARITKNKYLEEVLTVGLNEKSTDIPYLLGRLFAILEKTQQDAGNETIRARYFSSACATPGVVFPILLKLTQNHISKSEYGRVNDKRIESVLNQVEKFPSNLTLEGQGLFSLGYYHQRTSLWQKTEK
jgi:CRISPR-associated protein Csd1